MCDFALSDSACLRKGIMWKKSIDTKGVSWEERFLVLTSERLLISKINDLEVTCTSKICIWCMQTLQH